MVDAYVGAGAERISYKGVIYGLPGQFCGELPDLRMVISGACETDVKATLQGLLEEHIEMLLDNHEVLPEPNFRSIESLGVPTNANNVHSESFTVVVPSTADKDLLTSFGDHSEFQRSPKLRPVRFKAVVIKSETRFVGYFPDFPGAFTTSESIEETCRRLQSLLESQVGQLLKNGGAVPLPRFSSPTDFGGHLGSEPASEIVCMRQFSVEIPD